MNQFDFNIFFNNVNSDINRTKSFINEIEDFKRFGNGYPEQNDLNEASLAEAIDEAKLKIEFALEFLGLYTLLKSFKSEISNFKHLGELESAPVIDILYSPVVWRIEKYLNAVTSHVKLENKQDYNYSSDLETLERILKGTAKLLKDSKIEPNNEAEVRKEIYKILIHVFPGTVREIPISKVSKSYKPDIGIKKLKTAIEYKFVDSPQEAKTTIEGVFADIKGYAGSEDWKNFYAVFYMTDNFLTQFQIEEEFKISDVPSNWKPILVFGNGGRKNKKRAQ